MQGEESATQKSEVFSLSAPRDFIDMLDSASRKMGWKRAHLVRTVVNKYLDYVVNDRDEVPVTLWEPPECVQALDEAAKRMGVSRDEVVRTLLTKCLGLVANNGDEIPIVLRIPKRLQGDADGLKAWLDIKTEYLYRKLGGDNRQPDPS